MKLSRKNKKADEKSLALTKITNGTIEERRKEVLDKGKKFKYPVQYSKHKLVINTIIISFIVAVIGVAFGWFQF